MLQVDIDASITLKAPFITQSSSPGAYGFDSVQARTLNGNLFIPGTHIAGKLREAWEALNSILEGGQGVESIPSKSEISCLLGDPAADGDFTPRRKKIHFSDFISLETSTGGFRNRIQIEEHRKAANQGSLLTIEATFGSGRTITFNGLLQFDTPHKEDIFHIQQQIQCGMQWIAQIGAFRTIGFGELVDIQMGAPRITKVQTSVRKWQGATELDLIIEPSEPFCIAGRPATDNIFESSVDIPGGIIKGCIANKINHLLGNPSDAKIAPGQTCLANICKHFHQIRITHGFPSASCFKRPVRPPLSLVKADDLFDVALLENPCLINDRAPEFQVDWKDDSDVNSLFGWPKLKKDLRVRTAIDSETLRSADNQLFAYEMIIPDEHCWLARVHLDETIAAEDRDAVLNELSALLENRLLGLGKSKVSSRISVNPPGTVVDVQNIGDVDRLLGVDKLWSISLQSPALLAAPEYLSIVGSRKTLFEGYRVAWEELCPSLHLERFFARQFMSGGLYQHERFGEKDGKPYRPWVLTDSGSVFVFTCSDREKAKSTVSSWLKHGLSIPASTLKAYDMEKEPSDTLWTRCPFIPQNGYGEIAVNLEIHSQKKPQPGQYEDITMINGEEV